MDKTAEVSGFRVRSASVPNTHNIVGLIGAFGITVLGMLGAYAGGIRYNGTPSYPLGFYLLSALDGTPELGELVFACPPDTETFREARRRHYIAGGTCPSGYTPLIKKIAAREGDIVRVGSTVSINSVKQTNSEVASVDGSGRALKAYEGGVIASQYFLLLSDFYSDSFDSRYFGPLHRRQIIGHAQPFLTW